MVIVGPEGMTRERYAPEQARAQCVFEHVYFSRPDSIVFGRAVQESRENLGRLLARECPADADLVVPVPDSGVAAAHRLLGRDPASLPPGADPQSLRGPHVHRAVAGDPRFRREAEAEPGAPPAAKASAWCWWTIPSCAAPPAARSCAWCGRPARAKCTCGSPARPPSRRVSTAWIRPRKSELIAANHTVEEIRRFVEADSLGYLSLGSLRKAVADDEARILLRLLHRRLSDRTGQHRRADLGAPEQKISALRAF